MKIIVTGGAGFIGSHLVDILIKNGHTVVVVDNLSSGYSWNIPKGVDFINADLGEEKSYDLLPKEKFDAVYHLASHVGQELSFQKPIYDIKSNAVSTVVMFKWCMEWGVKRFIFASSVNVYGPINTFPVDENTRTNPKSPYAVGKIASEYLCRIYQDFGINITILRLFNIYGPRQDIDNINQGMASIYMSYVAKKNPILIKGSLDRFRDFTYVTDAAEAFSKCLENSKTFGKTYVLSSGVKTTVKQLIEEIILAYGYDPETYPIQLDKPTRNDQFGFYGDSSALISDIEWKPKVGLKEGLTNMKNWVYEFRKSNKI
jgi:UDP-glucose 4-epimerase